MDDLLKIFNQRGGAAATSSGVENVKSEQQNSKTQSTIPSSDDKTNKNLQGNKKSSNSIIDDNDERYLPVYLHVYDLDEEVAKWNKVS